MKRTNEHRGYILIGKGRPEGDAQRQLLQAAGVDTSSARHCHKDVLPARPTRPASAMPMRGVLLGCARSGDTLHVMNILCLGVSPDDVCLFLTAILKAGATVVIHQDAIVLDPASEMDGGEWPPERSKPVIDAFGRARHAAYMRTARAKKAQKDISGIAGCAGE